MHVSCTGLRRCQSAKWCWPCRKNENDMSSAFIYNRFASQFPSFHRFVLKLVLHVSFCVMSESNSYKQQSTLFQNLDGWGFWLFLSSSLFSISSQDALAPLHVELRAIANAPLCCCYHNLLNFRWPRHPQTSCRPHANCVRRVVLWRPGSLVGVVLPAYHHAYL